MGTVTHQWRCRPVSLGQTCWEREREEEEEKERWEGGRVAQGAETFGRGRGSESEETREERGKMSEETEQTRKGLPVLYTYSLS